MKLKGVLIVSCLVLFTASILAQSTGGAADPISGTWKGQMVRTEDDTARAPLNVELKFDGKTVLGTVTGPPQPGEIKSGTFDRATGALKFDVTVAGAGFPFVFEGTVVQGTVTGRVTANSLVGVFTLSKMTADSATAQQPGGSDVAKELRRSFGEVSNYIIKAADLVPADKYSYRPAQSVRTFGQLIAHIADAHNYFCAPAAGRNIQWSDPIEKGSTDKATLVPKLKQSIDACNTTLGGGASKAGVMIDNIGHTNLHYGNVITYMRMLGLVPPSS